MTIHITWYGHSTFSMDIDGTKVLIDPFFTDNPAANEKADNVNADFILITHGHSDHVGDTLSIAKRTGASVISNFEICNWISAQGYENVHPQHIGGGFNYPFGYLKLTIAHHGSSLPDGSYGGNPAGLLLSSNGKNIYFAGDTALFSSMSLYGDEGIDIAFLPIGDNFTMGPDDALRAVKLLRPKKVVPIHFNTWDLIAQKPENWKSKVEQETASKCILLNVGETIDL